MPATPIYAPGIVLDVSTASAANSAYQDVAKLDKLIAAAIENAPLASIWLRTRDGHPIGWDNLTTTQSIGVEVKALVLRTLYEKRAVHQRRLAQLGFHCSEAPR